MSFEKEEYTFPDNQDADIADDIALEIEIEDDTPEEDRGRQPMPKPIVEELEKDELEQYDAKAKEKLKQMRKVWHDERRAKEEAYREQHEAIEVARKLLEENNRMRNAINNGETEYISTAKSAAELEMSMAKKAYKEAYESGDSEALVDAQQKLNEANLKVIRANNLRPAALQPDNFVVQQLAERQQALQNHIYQEQQAPQPDHKALAWQERNSWFGVDQEMTAAALGLHEKLKDNGVEIGSDEYYSALDKTMRKRFSEHFGDQKAKPSTVVASASRSTASKKIKLSVSQLRVAKKLGLTPEQYAKEMIKLENKNG